MEDLNKKEPSYIMTIELERGKSDIIQIYLDSSPDELAFEFCKKNKLNLKAMQFLSSEIDRLLAKITIQSRCIQEEPEEESLKDKSINSMIANNHDININEIDEKYREETKPEKIESNLVIDNKSKNDSENMKNNTMNNNDVSNHFEIEIESNNIFFSNSLHDERKPVLIIKNNDVNYLVNKERRVAPVCSSNYPSRRLYEVHENMGISYKNQNTDSNSNNESRINHKLNLNLGSSYINSDLNNNINSKEKDNNIIKNDFDEICIVGNGNLKKNSSITDENKLNYYTNNDYNNTEDNNAHNNNSINNSNNPYKRLKANESIENIRTEPIDNVNNSFNSNKSKMEENLENSNENENLRSNVNMTMKKNYNKTNYDLNENSINISNNTVWKNKSGIGITDNSCFKKSNSGNIFNYNDFFDKMKKKSEHRKEISTNISNKTNFNDLTNLKKSSEMIIEKLNETIEKKILNERARSRPRVPEKVAPHQYLNIGERLYYKGIQEKQNKEKKIDEIKESIFKDEKKNLTFKPVINKSFLFNRITEQGSKTDNLNTIIKSTPIMTKSGSKDVKKIHVYTNKDENYSFSPDIDEKSKEIFKQKFSLKYKNKKITPKEIREIRINQMYERAKTRKNLLKKLDEQIYGIYNYTPNFNTNYVIESTFDERMEYFKNKSQEKKKKIETEMKYQLESKNGKRFFTPTLISRQITRENQPKSEIYHYMYSFAKKYDSNKIDRQENEIKQIRDKSSSIHTTYDSDLILNRVKQQNFEKIFKLLDSDQDDLISKFCIDLKKLPEEVRNIMRIITREIIEDDQTLNKREFMLAFEQLFEMLNYDERKIILNFSRNYNKNNKKQPSQNFSFKPKINKNSRKIDETLPYYISKSLTTSGILNNKSFDN